MIEYFNQFLLIYFYNFILYFEEIILINFVIILIILIIFYWTELNLAFYISLLIIYLKNKINNDKIVNNIKNNIKNICLDYFDFFMLSWLTFKIFIISLIFKQNKNNQKLSIKILIKYLKRFKNSIIFKIFKFFFDLIIIDIFLLSNKFDNIKYKKTFFYFENYYMLSYYYSKLYFIFFFFLKKKIKFIINLIKILLNFKEMIKIILFYIDYLKLKFKSEYIINIKIYFTKKSKKYIIYYKVIFNKFFYNVIIYLYLYFLYANWWIKIINYMILFY